VDYELIGHGLMTSNSDMSIYCLYFAGMSLMWRTFSLDQGDYNLRPVYRTWSLLLHCMDGNNFERVRFLEFDHINCDEIQFRDGLNECMITII
jgi:hypothetical protein